LFEKNKEIVVYDPKNEKGDGQLFEVDTQPFTKNPRENKSTSIFSSDKFVVLNPNEINEGEQKVQRKILQKQCKEWLHD